MRKLKFAKKETKGHDFKFELGSRVKDRITGFVGIIICRAQWLTNCNTYGTKSEGLYEGAPIETTYFDEPNIIIVESDVHEEDRDTGGPTDRIRKTNRL